MATTDTSAGPPWRRTHFPTCSLSVTHSSSAASANADDSGQTEKLHDKTPYGHRYAFSVLDRIPEEASRPTGRLIPLQSLYAPINHLATAEITNRRHSSTVQSPGETFFLNSPLYWCTLYDDQTNQSHLIKVIWKLSVQPNSSQASSGAPRNTRTFFPFFYQCRPWDARATLTYTYIHAYRPAADGQSDNHQIIFNLTRVLRHPMKPGDTVAPSKH